MRILPLTLLVSKEGVASYLRAETEYGFSESKVKPIPSTRSLHREQAKRDAGLCHLSPTRSKKAAGFKPNVVLLADYGFNAYSTLIETRTEIVDKKPDWVQRFVDASRLAGA